MTHLTNSQPNKIFMISKNILKTFILILILWGVGKVLLREKEPQIRRAGQQIISNITQNYDIEPLEMEGGNPYIRALMRTISASEANSDRPYHILYGGRHIDNLKQHPNQCVTIANGPNRGRCSTAAGRYQFLNTTWAEKANLYHPEPSGFLRKSYSFEPIYQDKVLYSWLRDTNAWGGTDITQLLEQGQINTVLELLSPTWTSLGYGIESNSITRSLPNIYKKMLEEELMNTGSSYFLHYRSSQ
ncbi:glycoside hydrolase family protein [Cyanobacterium stanieri LEGE 03274]|uniref:Glycoside hydrolase family protein n=1 Tax=Cyanobacterium stanieri LEGE 03274 TaxID=1828756 RepID=A0ABR9V0Y6_9CHRO|nr:glycoside hydrolase family protein [Cyanobacterium stanieri]MBE9221537.1 glycoside hydrolase family protein [Cyanobacterium stanieri LEGE 03274]